MPRPDKLAHLKSEQVENLLSSYLGSSAAGGRFDATDRYASFDFCYSYFRQFTGESTRGKFLESENIETTCLQLGFYLASWGMYRGSTDLLQKSGRALIPVLEYLATADLELWTLDVPKYDPESIEKLMSFYWGFHRTLKDIGISPTSTLRTKILLGTMGNIPAFDNYFARATGAWNPTPDFLARLKTFYEDHQRLFDSQNIKCLSFAGTHGSSHRYPVAKLIDMVFFQKGLPSR